MKSLPVCLSALALALAACAMPSPAAAAEWHLLGASVAPCRVEPFSDPSAAQRESSWGARCGGQHVRLGFEPAGASAVRASLNSVVTERFHPPLIDVPLISSLRLAWSAVGDAEARGLRTEQGMLAAASTLRLGGQWRIRAKVGRELVGGLRTRTTVTGVWRPSRGLLFAEWAGNAERTEMHRVGARWWLVPHRLALDIGARYLPDGTGWVDDGIRLSLFALNL